MDSSCLHTVYVRFLENRFLSVIQQTWSWHLLILWKQQTFFDIFTTCGDDVSTPLDLHDHSLDINVRFYHWSSPSHLTSVYGKAGLSSRLGTLFWPTTESSSAWTFLCTSGYLLMSCHVLSWLSWGTWSCTAWPRSGWLMWSQTPRRRGPPNCWSDSPCPRLCHWRRLDVHCLHNIQRRHL